MWQILVVAVVVALALVYAVWALMPQTLRRWLASALLRSGNGGAGRRVRSVWPARWQRVLERAALASPGCGGGCHGCDEPTPNPASSAKEAPLVFHPPRRR